MKYTIKFSNESQNNLKAIFFFIAQNSKENAHKYSAELKSCIKMLESQPHLGAAYSNNRRRLLCLNHYVYYKISESKKEIHIITVRHTSKRVLK